MEHSLTVRLSARNKTGTAQSSLENPYRFFYFRSPSTESEPGEDKGPTSALGSTVWGQILRR